MSQPNPCPPDLQALRTEYRRRSLSEHEVDPDPIHQFVLWLNEAIAAQLPEPNAMTLATAGPDGAPSARLMLLKAVGPAGFSFFTNYHSRKGRELDANPRAALAFFWAELERQVRVEGIVERTSEVESDEYFASRPRQSQVGAIASPQSQPIASRQLLEQRFAELEMMDPDRPIPRPAHWGGYRLAPGRIEFWQGRASRLHDRIEYTLDPRGQWSIRRLAP
jgi:pyridoxamine 5'-phosphate oxidase